MRLPRLFCIIHTTMVFITQKQNYLIRDLYSRGMPKPIYVFPFPIFPRTPVKYNKIDFIIRLYVCIYNINKLMGARSLINPQRIKCK